MLVVAGFAVVAAAGVWFTTTSWFVQREVADEAAFTETITAVLVTEESRSMIAETVVERAVEEVPVLALLAGPLRSFVSTILTAPVMEPAIEAIADQMYDIVVRGAPDPVLVDLAGATDSLMAAIDEVAPDLAALIPAGAFGVVELVAGGELPSFSRLVAVSAWLVWIGPLLVAAGIAGVVLRARSGPVALLAVGSAVMAGAVVSLVGIPLAHNAALADIESAQLLVIAEQSFDVLVRRFLVQTFWMLVAGALIALAGTVWYTVAGVRTVPAHEG